MEVADIDDCSTDVAMPDARDVLNGSGMASEKLLAYEREEQTVYYTILWCTRRLERPKPG